MTKMEFIQYSRLGNKTLNLEGKSLTVFGGSGSKKFEGIFDLRDVTPHFERTKGYRYSLIIVPLIVVILISACFYAVVRLDILPPDILPVARLSFITFIVTVLWLTIKGFVPIEIVRFRSRQGIVLFDVVNEKRQSKEFEQFVTELCERIRSEQSEKTEREKTEREGHAL